MKRAPIWTDRLERERLERDALRYQNELLRRKLARRDQRIRRLYQTLKDTRKEASQ
jgi:hypothetical protein